MTQTVKRTAALLATLAVLMTGAPAFAAHDGVINVRTAPEPSDIALAVFAAGAVWFVRRAMRSRFRRDAD